VVVVVVVFETTWEMDGQVKTLGVGARYDLTAQAREQHRASEREQRKWPGSTAAPADGSCLCSSAKH
jgi:hypothetical protein